MKKEPEYVEIARTEIDREGILSLQLKKEVQTRTGFENFKGGLYSCFYEVNSRSEERS